MGVSYHIDKERGLIQTRCQGRTTLADVLEHFRVLSRDPALPARPDVLLDVTEQETVPESDQLDSAAREVGALLETVEWGSCAIVADTDLLFGMMRVFQAFVDAYFANVTVVRDRDAAERWLASQPRPRH